MVGGLGLERLQFRDDPAIGVRQLDRLCVIDAAVLAFAAHQYVARCIPDLVAEIAIAGGAAGVEADVAPLRRQRGKRDEQRVDADRKSVEWGKVVAVRVVSGGRGFIKKKKKKRKK